MLLMLVSLLAFTTAASHAAAQTAATPPATPATPSPSMKSIEGVTSTIFQEKQSSFSGIGLRMRVRIPQLIDGFSIVPMIEYWRNRSTLEDFGVEATRKDAALGAVFRYDWKREGWQPYAATGIGLHFLSAQLDAPALGFNDESESLMKGGVILMGGIRFGLAGKLGNLIELEYHGLGKQSQLKFNWGLSYDF
jgi:hypothetical protein